MAAVASVSCCPACGAALQPDQLVWDLELRTLLAGGHVIRFTRREASIVDALWRTRRSGGIYGTERFAQMAWADDPDGGPDCTSTLHTILGRVRAKLEAGGLTVTYGNARPRQAYRIVACEGAKA